VEVTSDDLPLPALADEVVRGKRTLSPPQMRLLIELLPYHLPKLTAVATTTMNNQSFAEMLDRAIARSAPVRTPVKMIELKPVELPVEELPASELKKPFARMRRRV
jgi:hypothetical protein